MDPCEGCSDNITQWEGSESKGEKLAVTDGIIIISISRACLGASARAGHGCTTSTDVCLGGSDQNEDEETTHR